MSNFLSNQIDSSSSSSSCYLARTLKTKRGKNLHHQPATWSMSSIITALPQYPSPPPPPSDSASHFSTPRNQRLGMTYVENSCFSDIDEWLEHANKFCKSYDHHNEDNHAEQQRDLRISAVCNNSLIAQEHELYNIILPCVREETPLPQNITSSINRHPHSRLTRSRPNPYDELLNEHKRRKLEAYKDARNKAKHLHLMQRLRRKEEAINNWELQQTRKAMDHMDKIQNELERKQVMASAKTQKKIRSVRDKAEKQKLKLRQSTMKKFKQLQIQETHSSSDTSWDSRLHLY
ncbi:unnamed protein product [Vicia faba]|uniref:Remorin C-terminal domain-containing protein n=1 Tax=Vicia faba TaxID=3906 RepID=A0AAV1AAS9_VICFA|nr:unnamed protein product [Vicia faba]